MYNHFSLVYSFLLDNTMASYTHEKNDYREPGISKLLPWTTMRLRNPR